MKLVDVAARNAKELETIKRKVAKMVKEAGCNTGEIRWSEHQGGWWCEVENDGQLGDYLEDIIRKSPNAKVVEVKEHKGEYMWSADVYVRPVTTVHFKF